MEGVDGFLNFINCEILFKEARFPLRDPTGNDGFAFNYEGLGSLKFFRGENFLVEEGKGFFNVVQIKNFLIINNNSINLFLDLLI